MPSDQSVSSLAEFTGLVEQAAVKKAGSELWFRGCARASHKLVPTLFRHPSAADIKELLSIEQKTFARFRDRSVPYRTSSIDSNDHWGMLFLMQHFGVPTRLLDWSENPYVALFFSLSGAVSHPDQRETAAVWVLDPIKWNKYALSHLSFDEGVLLASDDRIAGYAPNKANAGMGAKPVAIYGAHNSPRIVAQRGVFTLFGNSTEAMESMNGIPQEALTRVLIPATATEAMFRSLLGLGFTDSMLFPDLEGIARDLKRQYGFKV